MRYKVSHIIRVDYNPPVRLAHFNLRLMPIAWPGQSIEQFELAIDPSPDKREERPGAYPFNLTRVEIMKPITTLEVRSSFVADVGEAQLDLTTADMSVAQVAQAALVARDVGPPITSSPRACSRKCRTSPAGPCRSSRPTQIA